MKQEDGMRAREKHSPLTPLLLCLLIASCSPDPAPPPATVDACDVTAFVPLAEPGGKTEVMVPMGDCVRMATDIHLPDGEGPFPTILIRLPYGKEKGMDGFPLMKVAAFVFTGAGYAVVIQDTRGRFASEGEWDPFLHEQRDGLDTVRWVEAQPWFDGNLGMFGGSYFAFTELAVAHQRPACLRAMVPLIISGSIYSWLYQSGLPRADIAVNWALRSVLPDPQAPMPEPLFKKAALNWPLMEGDDVTMGDLAWFNAWLEHPFEDGYYQRYLPADAIRRIQVPMLMLSGWFDIFLTGQLADFQAAREEETAPGNHRIIIGPWTHNMGVGEDHDYPFSKPGSLVSYIPHLLDWFDLWLKGETPARTWGPVRIYDPGTGEWTDRSGLWAPEGRSEIFFLHGDQGVSSCRPEGGLLRTPVAGPAKIHYTYDPMDPVIRYGGPLLSMESGCLLEEDGCGRPDILTFQSSPLPRDLPLDGEMYLEIPVSSSAPDTAFVARLALVKPDGKAYFLRQGVTTLSHRNGNTVQAGYEPGEVVALRIEMPPVLWTLREGERLRLEVSSSSFPSFVQHPNVDRDWFREASPRPAEQTLHLLPDRPARLVFRVDAQRSAGR